MPTLNGCYLISYGCQPKVARRGCDTWTRFRLGTFLGDRLKVTFEALVAAGHPEGEQHDVGGGHQREGAGHGCAQSEAAKQKQRFREGARVTPWQQERPSVGSPVKNTPPHGQQGVVHGEGVAHAVAGLDEERADGQADKGAWHGGELHVAAHTPPGGEDVERDPRTGEAGVEFVDAHGACKGEEE